MTEEERSLTTKNGIEIERKYLVDKKKLPMNFAKNPHLVIKQGYITQIGDSVEVRIRSETDDQGTLYFLTTKKGDGLTREETQIALDNPRYYKLWNEAVEFKLEKTRFKVRHQNFTIEVDVYDYDPEVPFTDQNIIAEIEIFYKDQLTGVVLPSWIGREITGIPEYSNAMIATNGFPSMEK